MVKEAKGTSFFHSSCCLRCRTTSERLSANRKRRELTTRISFSGSDVRKSARGAPVSRGNSKEIFIDHKSPSCSCNNSKIQIPNHNTFPSPSFPTRCTLGGMPEERAQRTRIKIIQTNFPYQPVAIERSQRSSPHQEEAYPAIE